MYRRKIDDGNSVCAAQMPFSPEHAATPARQSTHTGTCTVSILYEALMKYPDVSVIKPELFAKGSCEIIKAPLRATPFRCLCDGALVVSLAHMSHASCRLRRHMCPVNSGCRKPKNSGRCSRCFRRNKSCSACCVPLRAKTLGASPLVLRRNALFFV